VVFGGEVALAAAAGGVVPAHSGAATSCLIVPFWPATLLKGDIARPATVNRVFCRIPESTGWPLWVAPRMASC